MWETESSEPKPASPVGSRRRGWRKEDSSQEKLACVVLRLTRGVPETPPLIPQSWAWEISRQVGPLSEEPCLTLTDGGWIAL